MSSLEAGVDNLPREVMLELTDRCNLDCEYCFRSNKRTKGKILDWDKFISIVEKLDFIEVVALCGMGEQLIYPKFYEAVSYLSENNKKVAIITNGTVPINYERLYHLGNIKSITFSVDGTDSEVIKQICSKYDISKLLNNLELGRKYPLIRKEINCVITEKNIGNVIHMVSFCKEHGIDKLNMLLPTYSMGWIKDNIEEISCLLSHISNESIHSGIEYSSPYEMYCYYQGTPIPFISLNGLVRTCCDHFNRVPRIGNILESDFKQLYDTKAYQSFQSGKYCASCNMYKSLPSC